MTSIHWYLPYSIRHFTIAQAQPYYPACLTGVYMRLNMLIFMQRASILLDPSTFISVHVMSSCTKISSLKVDYFCIQPFIISCHWYIWGREGDLKLYLSISVEDTHLSSSGQSPVCHSTKSLVTLRAILILFSCTIIL